MTHALQPATPSRDGNALLALTVLLILTTWSFFGRFSVFAAMAGIVTALWLHWWNLRHPPSPGRAHERQAHSPPAHFYTPPMLNISAVYVGGDAAGLAFVAGTVVVFVMGLPPLRWFAIASAVLAAAFAAAVIAWHRTHSVWSTKTTSVVGP
jgi:hypothetical protein